MIIKSMSRKAPTFGQLMDYIARGSDQQTGTAFVRNIYADGADRAAVVGQFLDNYCYLPDRKNGNALYHEVVVLEPQPHLSARQIEVALHALAERYCEQRAPHQLVWGRVHLPGNRDATMHSKSTGFPHIHLMISANAVRSDRRVRMDRGYFAKVQRDLETWQADHLSELRNRPVYARDVKQPSPRKPSREGEMERRTGQPSRKSDIADRVREMLQSTSDRGTFETRLRLDNLELYQRGKSWGVRDDQGRKYRLSTLGLAELFEKLPETTRTKPVSDPRAADLLGQRMARQAQEKLHGFERE